MKEEIIEGNKIIAEFMGLIYQEEPDLFDETNIIKKFICKGHPDHMLDQSLERHFQLVHLIYHRSWDWLIPVICKIRESSEYIKYKQENTSIISEGGIYINTKYIIETWKEVVEFIKWYNENK